MNATDTARKGNPAVSTTEPLYGNAAAATRDQLANPVPATFLSADEMTVVKHDPAALAAAGKSTDPTRDLLELLAEHHVAPVFAHLPEGFLGFCARQNGRIVLILPKDGGEAENLAVARMEMARLQDADALRKDLAFTPCENAWCQETAPHSACFGQEMGLSASAAEPVSAMVAYLRRDRWTGQTGVRYSFSDNDDETLFRSGDDLRAETARVRAQLARLDALADQLDAILEADGQAPPVAPPAFCRAHAWCIEHDDDHGSATEPDRAHVGETATLNVPPHMEPYDGDPQWLMRLGLWATDRHYLAPRAYLAFDDAEEVSMGADQLTAFADSLGDFRNQVLAMAAQLRQSEENQR